MTLFYDFDDECDIDEEEFGYVCDKCGHEYFGMSCQCVWMCRYPMQCVEGTEMHYHTECRRISA